MDKEEVIKKIKEVVIPHSFIGIHGICRVDNISRDIQNMFQHGISHNYSGGLNSNTALLGEIESIDFYDIFRYSYGSVKNELFYNTILAIPKTLTDIYEEEYFIGPFEDLYLGNHEDKIRYVCRHPFNAWVNDKKCTLSEFIVGILVKNKNNEAVDFIINNNYLGFKPEDERKVFFEGIKNELMEFGLRSLKDDDTIFNNGTFYTKNFFAYLDSQKIDDKPQKKY